MRCQHCGHEVPEGSVFCNHCGYRLSSNMDCPHCGASIPATSLYCPKCGNSVEETVKPAKPAAAAATPSAQRPATTATQRPATTATQRPAATATQRPATTATQRPATATTPQRQASVINQQRRAAQQPARQPNAWQPPVENDEENDNEKRSNFNRNLIIAVIAVVALIGTLLLLRQCQGDENKKDKEISATAAMAADDNQDWFALFKAELSRANMTDDNANPVFAVKFNKPNTDSIDCVIGVTYRNYPDRPFIKIYKLTRDHGNWKPELVQTKYFDDRTIYMDYTNLITDNTNVPRAVTVGGRQCLFFALLDHLKNSENGRVTLCLFDIESKRLTTLNYDGELRQRDDGRQYVYGQPLESISGTERSWLAQEAVKIGALRIPTQEELDAEKKAEEEEEQEQARQDSIAAEKEKEKAQENAQSEKPTFKYSDIKSKNENDSYSVFLMNNGTVQGFNKKSRKYFVIYNDASNPAKGITLNGNDVTIETGNGSVNRNLSN